MKSKLVLVWFFLVACLISPAYQSRFTQEAAGEKAHLDQEKLPDEYYGNGISTESKSGKEDYQRTGQSRDDDDDEDAVHHLGKSRRAKGIYGGANDLKRPKPSKGSGSLFVKPNLFLSVALTLVTTRLLWVGKMIFTTHVSNSN